MHFCFHEIRDHHLIYPFPFQILVIYRPPPIVPCLNQVDSQEQLLILIPLPLDTVIPMKIPIILLSRASVGLTSHKKTP